MKPAKKRSHCGISSTLDILGDKWSLLIVRDMLFFRKKTYGDLLVSNEKIATNILADRLLLLEKQGIITKSVFQGNKSKYRYHLTQKGIDLLPILLEIMLWSNKYLEISERGKMLAERIRFNKMELMDSVITELKKEE